MFADSLISTVQRAVCDPLPEVRESAARTFDNLHSNIGSRALDDIIPHLLKKLVMYDFLSTAVVKAVTFCDKNLKRSCIGHGN